MSDKTRIHMIENVAPHVNYEISGRSSSYPRPSVSYLKHQDNTPRIPCLFSDMLVYMGPQLSKSGKYL